MEERDLRFRRLLLVPVVLGLVLGGLVLTLGRRPSGREAAPRSRPTGEIPRVPETHPGEEAVSSVPKVPPPSPAAGVLPSAPPPPLREVPAPPDGAAIRIDGEGVLRERGGEFGYLGARYGVTLGAGRVDVSAERGLDRPQFSYALEEIRAGDVVVARGGAAAPQARPGGKMVCYDRGGVEEQYAFGPEAVEQNFLIRDLPAGRGEITVRGRVETTLEPPEEGTAGPRLSFRREGREVLYVSEAVAVDAGGRRLPLELAYAGGALSIRVPAAWVEGAELPILVDPLIGGAITVDGAAVNPTGVADAAAYNPASNEWFVVWNEQFGASNNNIWGQRVSAAGALVGPAVAIGTNTQNDTDVAVCASGAAGKYLVAWSQGTSTASRIVGRVLDSTGTGSTAETVIGDLSGVDNRPDIAWDGARWFVVWDSYASGILGRFVSATGTPGTQVTVSAYRGQGEPKVAFTNGVYMIVWRYYGPMARTMNASGAFLADAWILGNPNPWIDVSKENYGNAICAGPAGKFLVSWINNGNEGRFMSLIANTAMGVEKSGIATLQAGVSIGGGKVSTAYSGISNEWFVAYEGYVSSVDVCATRVTAGGAVAGYERVASTTGMDYVPAAAWNSATNETLVVYKSWPPGGTPRILAQRYGAGRPPAPTGLTAAAGHTRVVLSWTASPGAATYSVKRATAIGGPYATVAAGIYGTRHVDEGLSNGTTYYYVVSASNASGEGANSAPVSATPTAGPVVTNLTATPGNSRVMLKWGVVAGALHYYVKRAVKNGGPYTVVGTPAAGSFEDAGDLRNGTTYYYVVTSELPITGESGPSNQVSATPVAPSASPAALFVVGNTTLNAGDSAVRTRLQNMGYSVTVKAASAASGVDANGKAIVVISSTVTSGDVNTKFRAVPVPVLTWENAVLDDLGMTGGTSGTDYGTTSGLSAVSVVHPDHRMSAGLSGSVTVTTASGALSWGLPNDNAVKIATLPGAPSKAAIFGYEKGASMPGLAAPARRTALFLTDATAATFTPGGQAFFDAAVRWTAGVPEPPMSLSVSEGSGIAVLTWDLAPGARCYTIKRSSAAGGPYVTIATGISGTSYTDTGIQNGSTYFYVVSAANDFGASEISSPVQAQPRDAGILTTIYGPRYIRKRLVRGQTDDDYNRGEYTATNWYRAAGQTTGSVFPFCSTQTAGSWSLSRGNGALVITRQDPVRCTLGPSGEKEGWAEVCYTATYRLPNPPNQNNSFITVTKRTYFTVYLVKRIVLNVLFRYVEDPDVAGQPPRRSQRAANLFADAENPRKTARETVNTELFNQARPYLRQSSIDLYMQQDMSLNEAKNRFNAGWNDQGEFMVADRFGNVTNAFGNLPENNNVGGIINVYLLRRIRDTNPETCAMVLNPAVNGPDRLTVLLDDRANGHTLAHEIGHTVGILHTDDFPEIGGTLNNGHPALTMSDAMSHMLMYSGRPGDWFSERESYNSRDNSLTSPARGQVDP